MTLEPDTGESDSTIRWSTEVESTKVSYTDINHDGILELPSAYALPDPNNVGTAPNFWAIRWWQYDINGVSHLVYTPTTTAGTAGTLFCRGVVGEGDALPQRLGGRRRAGRNLFLLGGKRGHSAGAVPGHLQADRRQPRNAGQHGRPLSPANTGEEKETIYAARLIESGWDCGLDEEA